MRKVILSALLLCYLTGCGELAGDKGRYQVIRTEEAGMFGTTFYLLDTETGILSALGEWVVAAQWPDSALWKYFKKKFYFLR